MASPNTRPRILFLDAYDSFANNITALLATLLDVDVYVLPIDAAIDAAEFYAETACYDAVVCGPGPGSPDCAADIGLMKHVWATEASSPLASTSPSPSSTPTPTPTPTLGICLGFQSLVAAHGGRIRRLRSGGLHGMVRPVDARQHDIFAGVPPFRATLYHSLGADVGQDSVPDEQWTAAKWDTVAHTQLQPLAWVEEPLTPTENERILMGVRHATLPLWGLQYHPESVCTDAASHAVLANWFQAAVAWNRAHGRVRAAEPAGRGLLARQATRPSLLSQPPILARADTANTTNGHAPGHAAHYTAQTIPLPLHVQVPDIAEILHDPSHGSEPEHIILDSASAAAYSESNSNSNSDSNCSSPDSPTVGDESDTDAIRGRYSIIALDVGSAARFEYRTGDRSATLRQGTRTVTGQDADAESTTKSERIPLGEQSIWQLLAEYHESKRAHLQIPEAAGSDMPFLGGFMGYVTYEQGLDDIGVAVPGRSHSRPDICWAWVTRSIVVDHQLGVAHVQSIAGLDAAWVSSVVSRLQAGWASAKAKEAEARPHVVDAQFPDEQRYEDLVRQCQEYIAAGESYELCLTGETRITTLSPADADGKTPAAAAAWALYRALRKKNPAPFASYLRLGAATLISSSPERFLCFGNDGHRLKCSMRPMKGTVRRSSTVRTLADAEALLHVPKEEAENLMIVDLVRHDLHAVCGPGGVHVPRLLQVEPYGHVFQMVSVVEGTQSGVQSAASASTGIDVLSVSLPPGSMTGAPKKRSCALLTGMEHEAGVRHERSLYSGVVGYVCVSGRGDWSVTIRSLFRWDDEATVSTSGQLDAWHIGAGGAVTILSTPEGEREEMVVKLGGPLGVFDL